MLPINCAGNYKLRDATKTLWQNDKLAPLQPSE